MYDEFAAMAVQQSVGVHVAVLMYVQKTVHAVLHSDQMQDLALH